MNKKITYASVDDWAAVYVDGKIYEEGHSIPIWIWLELLEKAGAEVKDLSYDPAAEEVIQAKGRFPEDDEWTKSVQAG